VPGKMPGFVPPCLPELWERSPDSDRCTKSSTTVSAANPYPRRRFKACTRRGNDWSHRFKRFSEQTELLSTRSAILDGEVVAESESGHSDSARSKKIQTRTMLTDSSHVFDLSYLDDLRAAKLIVGSERSLPYRQGLGSHPLRCVQSFRPASVRRRSPILSLWGVALQVGSVKPAQII
jgi:bifunctional non-homologous end joining protein LigD